MEINLEIKNTLKKLGINDDSLSEKEKKYLTEIFDCYCNFVKEYNSAINIIDKLKFNKSIVADKVSCSRQALYNNPTLMIYLEYLIKETNKLLTSRNNKNFVSREKYDLLKEENSALLINIVKDKNKDIEIDRLTKELKEERRNRKDLALKCELLSQQLEMEKRKNSSFRAIN